MKSRVKEDRFIVESCRDGRKIIRRSSVTINFHGAIGFLSFRWNYRLIACIPTPGWRPGLLSIIPSGFISKFPNLPISQSPNLQIFQSANPPITSPPPPGTLSALVLPSASPHRQRLHSTSGWGRCTFVPALYAVPASCR